ncbi:hypothetical protein FSP39_017033 [Pinctada imbricata]|uniref:Uncharacterized protein n=1 Tax=Pinctada imbricata TaxID=66713 RepID=A0AA88YIV5_PINIB|nr:hypothetical protein FSP39_017033 [Pinctada imbricata]
MKFAKSKDLKSCKNRSIGTKLKLDLYHIEINSHTKNEFNICDDSEKKYGKLKCDGQTGRRADERDGNYKFPPASRRFEKRVQVCSSTQNNICGDCRQGFFRLPSTHQCVSCSPCPEPGSSLPRHEVQECKDTMPGSSNIWFFRLSSTHQCVSCSPCPEPGSSLPRHEVQECKDKMPGSSNICFPIGNF